MKITSQNIDKWLFDYYEGNLSEEQMQELDLYCLLNPEADAEKMAWEQAYFKDHDEPIFDRKDDLIVAPFWNIERSFAAALLLLLLPAISFLVIYPFAGSDSQAQYVNKLSKSNNFNQNENNLLTSFGGVESLGQVEDAKNSHGQRSSTVQENTNPSENTYITADATNANRSRSDRSRSYHTDDVHQQLAKKPIVEKAIRDFEQSNAAPIHTVSTSEPIALYQEVDKYDEEKLDHRAAISSNPDYQGEKLALARNLKEIDLKKSSFSISVRRFFRRLFRHEVALSNLRDPNIIVPDFQLMNYNSSFAGSVWASRFDARYRTRWLGDDQFMHKATFSYDTYLPGLKGGIGIVANFKDFGQGAVRDYNLSVIYSPKLQVAKEVFIEPSIKLTLGSHQANGNKLVNNGIEWNNGFVLNNLKESNLNGNNFGFYQDLGAGLMINTKWFYAGAMFDNLARHRLEVFSDQENLIRMPKRYSAVIATDYQSEDNERFIVSPFVAYEHFGEINEFWAGSHLRWNGLLFGASISSDINFKGQIGFQAKGFKMSYSYDHTRSYLHDKKIGSHAITMRVNMNQFNNSKRRRY